MNKQILIAMDAENRSKEELKKNYHDAVAGISPAIDAAVAAFDAAAVAAADAAVAAADAAAVASDPGHWINKYFQITNENRENYEKALGDMRK
jgi:hypothetical protein